MNLLPKVFQLQFTRTDWTQERFVEVMKEYSKDILTGASGEEKFQNRDIFLSKKKVRNFLKTYKSLLKKLGHYRLSECGLGSLQYHQNIP